MRPGRLGAAVRPAHQPGGHAGVPIGDTLGAAIAVALIGLVRGQPDKAEVTAAEGGALSG